MGGWQPGYKLGMREGGEVMVGQVQKMIKDKGTLSLATFLLAMTAYLTRNDFRDSQVYSMGGV